MTDNTTMIEPAKAEQNIAHEQEKDQYWGKLLTGNLEKVPFDVRHKAGADNEQESATARDYRLASNINRSWVVDHRNLSKEQVRAEWPELRMNLAREMGVQNDEMEVYTALSMRHAEKPVRQKIRQVYSDAYTSALKGLPGSLPDEPMERRACETARLEAARAREEYMPLAESVSAGWSAIKSMESSIFPLPDVLRGTPGLLHAVDALAEMPPVERAKVYEVARSLDKTRQLEDGPLTLGDAMLRSVRRGVGDLRHGMVQGAGHIATALAHAAGETLDSSPLKQGAAALDKRLQTLQELRRVAQGEVFPINLDEESGFLEELALEAAGAAPGAALAFMGGAGFGALSLAGAGAAVAEARHRSPEGRQELQTAAGIVGGALQAGIYMGMSRIGAQMLNRSINNFLKARNAGVKGYSLAALNTLGTLSAENAKLLLAGKAAHASELGMQELAARVDHVASNIDWESFGDNILDIEENMRESAQNLPFVLIAAGRAGLHHFRSQDAVLDNRPLLREWGVDDALYQRIMDTPDVHARTEMLREAMCSSRRWCGPKALADCIRSLKLLNTDYHTDFSDQQVARQFLNMPSEFARGKQPEPITRDVADPEVANEIAGQMNARNKSILNQKRSTELMQLWDEWNQKCEGNWFHDAESRIRHINHYQELHQDPIAALPREFRLDGYYNPHSSKVVLALRNDLFSEIVKLSYRYIMNSESMESLMYSYKSTEQARTQTENKRRMFVTKLCEAVGNCFKGDSPSEVFDGLSEWIAARYENRRRVTGHAPMWMKKVSPSDFRAAIGKEQQYGTRFRKQVPERLQEMYAIMLGVRACGESLVQLMPHSEDFQELLSQGFSPEQAVPHLLKRELAEHYVPELRDADPLTAKARNKIDTERRFEINKHACNLYMLLSGYGFENTTDGEGKQLWRIKRPDGRLTPWFPAFGMAVNSMVNNVKTRFLPLGKGLLEENIAKSYRYSIDGTRTFYDGYMFRLPVGRFTGFDHMGRVAIDDLSARWLGDSTLYSMGLEFAPDKKKWGRLRGDVRLPGIKEIKDGNDGYLVKMDKVETPLSLARKRFFVHWHRLLTSGWITPEAVGEALVEAKEMKQEELDKLLEQGRDKLLYLENKSGPRRRQLLRIYPDKIVPGNETSVLSELARRMADFNVLYMLADLPDAKVPKPLREWCYTCAFSEYREPEGGPRLRGLVRKKNRLTAEYIKSLIPRVAQIRELKNATGGLKLGEMLRDTYEPNESRRYEQGWCFAVGGQSAFRSAGQTFWNLLEDPIRGWRLLTPQDREMLSDELREFCGTRTPEAALQELSDVLKRYPGLRAYSSDLRQGGALKRMNLNPISQDMVIKPELTLSQNTRLMHPPVIRKGFEVEEHAELPVEWAADSRVLPALQLLTELRRNVTAAPYVDDDGIWWQQERYGGLDGKRPNGVDERWTPEVGLQPFLKFYKRVKALGRIHGTPDHLNVCGVPLGGIGEGEIDADALNQVTIYRSYRLPEHQVRLMPGEPNAANPYQRKPYVVHTADGVPLLPNRMARHAPDVLQALTPLNHFRSDLERMYDYKANQRWRRAQLESYLNDLLLVRGNTVAAWDRADEGYINNMEMFMQIFQDSRLSYYLEDKDPTQLTRGEALAAELGRLMLLAEFSTNRDEEVQNLVNFCRKLKDNPVDKNLLQATLHRVVSPEPNRYSAEELILTEKASQSNQSSENAQDH